MILHRFTPKRCRFIVIKTCQQQLKREEEKNPSSQQEDEEEEDVQVLEAEQGSGPPSGPLCWSQDRDCFLGILLFWTC